MDYDVSLMFYFWHRRGMNNPTEIYNFVKSLTSNEKKVLEAFVSKSEELRAKEIGATEIQSKGVV